MEGGVPLQWVQKGNVIDSFGIENDVENGNETGIWNEIGIVRWNDAVCTGRVGINN